MPKYIEGVAKENRDPGGITQPQKITNLMEGMKIAQNKYAKLEEEISKLEQKIAKLEIAICSFLELIDIKTVLLQSEKLKVTLTFTHTHTRVCVCVCV